MAPMYDFNCVDCNTRYDIVVKYEERDNPGVAPCPCCSSVNVIRQFPSPMVSKASYPDGFKRPGWDTLKEAAKMEVEKAGQLAGTTKGDAERARIGKMIKGLRKTSQEKITETTTGSTEHTIADSSK